MRKSQGLSVNTIIIAAIALIVLVVLIAIFTGRMGDFINKLRGVEEGDYCPVAMIQASSCPAGTTQVLRVRQCTENTESQYINKCQKEGMICCVE